MPINRGLLTQNLLSTRVGTSVWEVDHMQRTARPKIQSSTQASPCGICDMWQHLWSSAGLRRWSGSHPQSVSIIVPALNEGENLRKTVQSLQQTTTGHYEIIVVDNGSTDGSTDFLEHAKHSTRIRLIKTGDPLGVAGARNLGSTHATGDILVFTDAHVLFPPHWMPPLLDALQRDDVGIAVPCITNWDCQECKGYGFRWSNAQLDSAWLALRSKEPYAIPLAPGMCMALRRQCFEHIGRFDPGMRNWGSEDFELCLRTWLLGYQVLVVPQVEISHYFRGGHPYTVDWQWAVYNTLRMVYSHFDWDRTNRVLAGIRSLPAFDAALDLLHKSDVWERRHELELRRKYTDDWFFDRFDMHI